MAFRFYVRLFSKIKPETISKRIHSEKGTRKMSVIVVPSVSVKCANVNAKCDCECVRLSVSVNRFDKDSK